MPSNENNKVNLEALTFGDAVVVWSRSNTKGWAIPDSTNGKFANRIKTYRRLIASGDGNKRHFSLLKYWRLILAPQYRNKRAPNDYEQHKAYVAKRNAEFSKQARDIGDIPEVVNPGRKAECEKSFRAFCETYFSHTFSLDWSPDHLKAIGKIEQSVLHGGLFALAMPRGSGKALALDTPLPTPAGWTTMGEVKIGDILFDERGRQCRVLMKSDVFTDHDCYKVTFSDGEEIVCDAGHLWQVEDIFGRKNPYVRTTEWLASRYEVGKRGYHERRFRIPMQQPIQIQSSGILPISPYALGIWLGDGTSSTSNVTLNMNDCDEIIQNIHRELGDDNLTVCRVEEERCSVVCILSKSVNHNRKKNMTGKAKLRRLGLLHNKHIPSMYLRATVADRLALLQGILDTDGHSDKGGHIEICIKYPQFAEDFAELLSSLGIKFGLGEKMVMLDGKEHGPYYRFSFNGYRDQNLFRLKRKQERMRERPVRAVQKTGAVSHTPCDIRTIAKIELVPTVPTQCVMVDSPSHLYLAGKGMIPTHNSSLSETACIWAMLYGHREFIALVGSTEVAALEILDSIKTSIESNPELSEDFPEVTYPIHQLDGIANRCAGQLYHGERTRITWTSNEIVLPTIEGSRASGIVVRVAGITGRVRGMKFKRQDGRSVRPSLVIIDDPQTAESAGSIEQTKKRVRVLVGDILGLAGPGQKISGIMPCTIIRPGDMADQILDAGKHPEWNGERCKMIYEYPKNMDLWEQYAEIRMESLREDGNFKRATEFYAEHRAEMDEGAVVSWEARHNHDEISALQNAMNLKFQDEIAFQSEYQNEPVPEDLAEDNILSVDEIIQKISGVPKCVVPLDCVRVTMFVDIQKTLLFYCVCAWSDDFTGSVIDYGAWPDQHRLRFTLADAGPTIQDKFKKAGFEGQLFGALTALFEEKMQQEFRREDGAILRIERAMIDANWGLSTDIVYQFCRTSQWASLVYPAHGRYVGATSKPMTEYRKERGARLGFNWYMPSIIGKRAVRHVIFDTNFWKSFVHARLAVALGDKGSLTLYGRNPLLHQLFAEHLTAEYKVAVEAKGRKVDEWKLRPQRADNHWLDCLAGCAVCASMQGSALPVQMNAPVQKERIHLSARQASHQAISFPDNYAPSPASVQAPARIKLSDLQKTKNYAMT